MTATLPGIYKPSVKQQASQGICIYGRGGAGKTTLSATMPGKGLIIDVPQFEGGTFVLSEHAERIDIVPCTAWREIDDIFLYLSMQPHDYKWVAIDSITGMQELAKRKVIGERDISADPHTISLQEYGKIGRLISELVFRFRTLRCHTLWIAQERTHGGNDGSPAVTGPDLTPAALSSLIPSMALLGRLSVEQNTDGVWERRLRIGPCQDYHTKYRALPGVDVPDVIVNPNLTQILRWNFALPGATRPEEAVIPAGFFIS